jgi:hypothetical protein
VQRAIPDGTSLLVLDMEDARLADDPSGLGEPRLDGSTYASYGIFITNATIRTGPGLGEMFARSGTTYLEARRCLSDCRGRSSVPIRLTFSSARLGTVKRVRIHLGRVNEQFFDNLPYILTCYNGPETVGSVSGLPTIGYGDWVMTYLPLEVAGSKITDCTIQLDGMPVLDDVEIVAEPNEQATVHLTCPADVERGRSINCTVAAKPGGPLSDIRWEFVDSAGHTIPGPAGQASWGGTMVVGGTMKVSAIPGGAQGRDSARAAIRVRPRNWPRPLVTPTEKSPNHLPAPANVRVPFHLGDTHVDTASNPALTGQRLSSGPNTGWWYLPRAITDIPVAVHINDPAFQSGSAWYNLQTGGAWTDPATGTTHPNGYCTTGQVPTLHTLTREHEGSIGSTVVSHVEAMRMYIASSAPQDSMEKVMAWDGDVQTFTFAETVISYYRAYIIGSLAGYSAPHTPSGVVPPAAFPCAARPWH